MSFSDAVNAQPAWLQIWLYWLVFAAFVLPLALLVWRQSRMATVLTLVAGVCAGFAVSWLFSRYGYVRLLGLGHIPFWTPLAYYLFTQIKRADMPAWPRRIMIVIVVTLLISLAFDYVDTLRYVLGERAPLVT
jgi:hypothetical protein